MTDQPNKDASANVNKSEATAFDAWKNTYRSLALALNPDDPASDLARRLKYAFLAGQRSERDTLSKYVDDETAICASKKDAGNSYWSGYMTGLKNAVGKLASREPKGAQ